MWFQVTNEYYMYMFIRTYVYVWRNIDRYVDTNDTTSFSVVDVP